MGIARQQDDPNDPTKQSQRVVCFSETPLEHVNLMCGAIEGRSVEMEPYGIALTKLQARRLGINPVWYLDTTPGRDWTLANTLDGVRDAIVEQARAENENFHEYGITALFPFIEQMGTWSSDSRKEFWWEREWRHAGHLVLPSTGMIWLCPEADLESVTAGAGYELRPWLDPFWGLEEIIAHLSGFAPRDVTPFWND